MYRECWLMSKQTNFSSVPHSTQAAEQKGSASSLRWTLSQTFLSPYAHRMATTLFGEVAGMMRTMLAGLRLNGLNARPWCIERNCERKKPFNIWCMRPLFHTHTDNMHENQKITGRQKTQHEHAKAKINFGSEHFSQSLKFLANFNAWIN